MKYQARLTYPELTANGTVSNELHIWMMENFGLTGDRYQYHPEIHHMVYTFRDEKDAMVFALRWGGRIVKMYTVD